MSSNIQLIEVKLVQALPKRYRTKANTLEYHTPLMYHYDNVTHKGTYVIQEYTLCTYIYKAKRYPYNSKKRNWNVKEKA